MAVLVQKFGGSSVDGPGRIRHVARRVVERRREGHDLIVVVSAMGRTTDEMLELANAVHPEPPQRELDMLVTAGERIAMSLLAMAIHAEGVEAISFTGSQSGIITDASHGDARIVDVRAFRIREELARGRVVIVAGYQGVSEAKEVTTLGRGGSDLTAVALAAAFAPSRCELLKDVDGVLTIDPRYSSAGRVVSAIPSEAMLALSRTGATVVHEAAVEYAIAHGQRVAVRSSFHERPGTEMTHDPIDPERVYASAISENDTALALTIVGGARALDRLDRSPPPPGRDRSDRSAHARTWTFLDRDALSRALDLLASGVLGDGHGLEPPPR